MHTCRSGIRATFVWRGWMETRGSTSLSVCVIVSFGVEDVAFGGDWAVAIQVSSYWRWIVALGTITARLLFGEQRQLWSDNARDCYRLTAAEWATPIQFPAAMSSHCIATLLCASLASVSAWKPPTCWGHLLAAF
jgi:hypothetical protein